MRRYTAALAAALAAYACSEPPAQVTGNACAGLGEDTSCAAQEVLVVASDIVSSAVGGFRLDGSGYLLPGVELGGDPALATSGGRSFFIARDRDVVLELDRRCGLPRVRLDLHDPQARGASNPQDVAVAPDGALWVPRFDTATLAVTDPCGAQVTNLDLSSYDELDHNPNASAIRIAEVDGAAKAFVALERLDDPGLSSTRPSQMLRIDVASRRVEGVIELAGRNPFGQMAEQDGAFFLAEPGNFAVAGEVFAGVERFDARTSTSRLIARETPELGGSVSIVAVTAGCGVAIVAEPTAHVNRTALVTFDLDTGAWLSTFGAPAYGPTQGYDLMALAWAGDVLLVGDRRRTPRGYAVHAFDRGPQCTLRARPDTVFLDLPAIAFAAPR